MQQVGPGTAWDHTRIRNLEGVRQCGHPEMVEDFVNHRISYYREYSGGMQGLDRWITNG